MAVTSWSVVTSAHPLRDRWISVRADHCRTGQGVDIVPFYVLEYPDWVLVVAIDEDDHLIMVEQYRHALATISLELPTGAMEPEDANPLAAARRKLGEETGYAATAWHHIVTLAPKSATHTNHCHVLLATGATAARVVPDDDPTEQVRVRRMPVAEAVGLAKTGGIMQALHVAALAVALSSAGRW